MSPSYLVYLAEVGATNIHPLGREATACLLDALRPPPGARLLEVGCGTAETMVRLILQQEVWVDGIESLLPMLRVGHKRLRLTGAQARSTLMLADGKALPVAGATYDAVYTESVLGYHKARTAQALLREIRRVLKPGARYVANEAVWKKGTDRATSTAVHYTGVADFGLSQASPQPWSVDEWISLMKATGFDVQAADLLRERVDTLDRAHRADRPWQLQLSAALTACYRLRGWVVPRLLGQKLHYRRLLARHAEDGRHLEARLFVLVAR